MGQLSLVAKVTHVPTMLMSKSPGRLYGTRQHAIDGHREISRRARALGVDTFVVIDTHWVINAGYHINANHRFEGIFTSNEFPQFIQDLSYAYAGNAALGDLIADKARAKELDALAHQIDSLELEYGTLVPVHYMNDDGHFKVVAIGGWCTVHDPHQSSRRMGEAVREAAEASDSNVALLASGSLSHKIWQTGNLSRTTAHLHHLQRVQPASGSARDGTVAGRRDRHFFENAPRLRRPLRRRR